MDVRRRTWLMRLAAGSILSWTVVRIAASQHKPRRVIDLRIKNRKVVSPNGSIRVTHKEVIELRVESDELVELHLHGYDQELLVGPGKPASLIIDAHATGRFPITSHRWATGGHGHDALTYLEVYPR